MPVDAAGVTILQTSLRLDGRRAPGARGPWSPKQNRIVATVAGQGPWWSIWSATVLKLHQGNHQGAKNRVGLWLNFCSEELRWWSQFGRNQKTNLWAKTTITTMQLRKRRRLTFLATFSISKICCRLVGEIWTKRNETKRTIVTRWHNYCTPRSNFGLTTGF